MPAERVHGFRRLYPGHLPGSVPGAHSHAEGDLPDASTVSQGVVELATSAETITGTDTTRATTPAGVKAATDSKADDTAVVHKSTAETVTGIKTFDQALVQKHVATPSTPASGYSAGPYFDSTTGLPYYLNAFGIRVPFNVGADVAALHANADYEAQTAGVPDSWDGTWGSNSTISSITTAVLAGTRAVEIVWSAAGNRFYSTSVITVTPGEELEFWVYAKKAGSVTPDLALNLLTKVSGTPDIAAIDPATSQQGGTIYALTDDYLKYVQTFVVPEGHTVARWNISMSISAAGGVNLDASGSRRSAASLADLDWIKRRVKACAVGNINLASPGASIDGVTMSPGNRFLAPAQTTAADCGVYVWNGAAAAATRSFDAASSASLAAAEVAVEAGTVNGGSRWVTTFKSTDTLGTTAMVWSRRLDAGDSAQVAQSANITPNGTANSTLTGLSTSVNCPGPNAVYMVSLSCDVQFNGAQVNIIELLVDGVAETAQLISGASAAAQRHRPMNTWRITGLAAGSRTFTARTRNSGAGTNAVVNQNHSLLTVARCA